MTNNQITNWIIRPVAVSSQTGNATFYSDVVTGATGSLNKNHDFVGRFYRASMVEIEVRTTTVDAEISSGAPPPQFMKIDVEGHELAVLRGARRTLSEHRPFLIFETTSNHEEVGDLLQQLGYMMLDLSGAPLDVPRFNTIGIPAEMQSTI
jgi:FkbM family methyltransferase